MKHLICNHCGAKWIPRTPNPKKCPDCTSRLWNKPKK